VRVFWAPLPLPSVMLRSRDELGLVSADSVETKVGE
jgi:hypothetical protein